MKDEPSKPSLSVRLIIVAATVILLGTGWVGVQREPGRTVVYGSKPLVEVTPASFDDGGAVEPRICQPEKGVDSACIYE
jgi:hypothetical protein